MPFKLENKAKEYLKANGISTADLVLNLRFCLPIIGCITEHDVKLPNYTGKFCKEKSVKADCGTLRLELSGY